MITKQSPSLMTEFIRLDDVDLLDRFGRAQDRTNGESWLKTQMLLEIMVRMGNFSLINLSEAALTEVKGELDRVVEAMNKGKLSREGRVLQNQYATRLAQRYNLAQYAWEKYQDELYGTQVQEVENEV